MKPEDYRSALDQRLHALERDLASFKQQHDASHSAGVQALEEKIAAMRRKVAADLARGDQFGALRDEWERDIAGLSAALTALIVGAGR